MLRARLIFSFRTISIGTMDLLVLFLRSSPARVKAEREPRDERDGECDDARHLRRFEYAEHEIGVVAAEILEAKSRRRVEHDVERECLSLHVGTDGAIDEEQREYDEVELSFPHFRRPQRLSTVRLIRERRRWVEYAKRAARRRAESVAIQKISAASESLPEHDGGADDVGECPRVDAMPLRVDEANDDAEEHAALYRHAALPDVEELREMVVVVRPVKEKDVPEARAEYAREPAVYAHVDDMLMPAPVGFGEVVRHTRREYDGETQHEPVRPYGEIPDEKKILMQCVTPSR